MDDTRVETLRLSEIFPNVPLDYIEGVVKDTKGDMDRSTELLLNYELIAEANDETEPIKSQERETDMAEVAKRVSEIETCEKVMKLLDIPSKYQELADYYCERNDHEMSGSVLDILENWDPSKPAELQPMKSYRSLVDSVRLNKAEKAPTEVVQPVQPANPCIRSRVQGGYTMLNRPEAHGSLKASKKKSEHNLSVKSMQTTRSKKSTQTRRPQSTKKSMEELGELRASNPALARLPETFFTDSLRFFHGNIERVAYVASVLAPEMKEQTIPIVMEPLVVEPEPAQIKPITSVNSVPAPEGSMAAMARTNRSKELRNESRSLRQKAISSSDKRVKAFYAMESASKSSESIQETYNSQQSVATQLVRQAARTNQIDLHGLLVDVALDCCNQVLTTWWNEEIDSRVVSGKKLQGQKATNVGSFTIITGRGLHSEGGRARIKPAVRKLLNREGYRFDEESSAFIVTGKRVR